MPQFDVYEVRSTGGLAINCQSDLLGEIATRLIVPLIPPTEATWAMPRIAPVVQFQGTDYVLATPLAAGVRTSELRGPIGSLAGHRHLIIGAFDLVLTGV